MTTPVQTPSQPSAHMLVGDVLGGRYELRAMLGRGGMGEVYEAVDRRLDRTVAIKVLRPELAADRRFVARFQREARTVARLSHPGIVTVYDVVEDDGRIFLVLEHVPGSTLSTILGSGPTSLRRAASIGAAVAAALAHAHGRGVVHRDVAPGNVMLRDDGRVKVLDFGIARAAHGSSVGLTSVHGTVAYAAPEVRDGRPGDQRVDIYGLGAVVHELALGVPPGPEGQIDARVPEPLRPILDRCLQPDPSRRETDAGALARALREVAPSLPNGAPPRAPRPEQIATPTRPGRAGTGTQVLALPPTGTRGDGTRPLPSRTPGSSPRGRPAARGRRGLRSLVGATLAVTLAAGATLGAGAFLAARATVPATVHLPPPLRAPAAVTAAASCDGFWAAGADVSWTGVAGATGYQLWRRALDEPWQRVQTLATGVTTTRDADLGVDRPYVYRVRALEGPLAGRWSEGVTVSTPLLCLT